MSEFKQYGVHKDFDIPGFIFFTISAVIAGLCVICVLIFGDCYDSQQAVNAIQEREYSH